MTMMIKGYEVKLDGKDVELVKGGKSQAQLNIYKTKELETGEIAVYFSRSWNELKDNNGIKLTKEEYEYCKNLFRNAVQNYLDILSAQSEVLVKEYSGYYYLLDENTFINELTNNAARQEAFQEWLKMNKKYLVETNRSHEAYEATTYFYTYKKEEIKKIDEEIKEKHERHIDSAEYKENKERTEKLHKWASEYDDRTFNEMTGLDREDYR